MKSILPLLLCVYSLGITNGANFEYSNFAFKTCALQEIAQKNTTIQSQQTFSLTIKFQNLKSEKGNIMLQLLDTNNQSIRNISEKITDKAFQIILKNIPAGTYSVKFYHDKNENQKLDFNLFGIPKESFGFSNNVTGFMGPPKFEKTLFKLSKDKTIVLKAY